MHMRHRKQLVDDQVSRSISASPIYTTSRPVLGHSGTTEMAADACCVRVVSAGVECELGCGALACERHGRRSLGHPAWRAAGQPLPGGTRAGTEVTDRHATLHFLDSGQ